MSRLPVCSGQEAARVFRKLGYELDHQTGSHMILRNPQTMRRLTVPNHRELARGTLRALIREAGISKEQFAGRCEFNLFSIRMHSTRMRAELFSILRNLAARDFEAALENIDANGEPWTPPNWSASTSITSRTTSAFY